MLEYVKICPKCGHVNPEDFDICENKTCREFLGFEAPVHISEIKDKIKTQPETQVGKDKTEVIDDKQQDPAKLSKEKITLRFETAPVLYLDLPGTSNVYEVQNGWIVGQADPTSNAHVQISDIQGVNFIHREHCSFDYVNGQWFVTTIAHEHFTNPTFVNHQRIQPGQRYPINNGDRLTLSNVTFNVRIIKQ
jgi:pSer/pThr/pTyr-binding forkhead associated (FHA) protein